MYIYHYIFKNKYKIHIPSKAHVSAPHHQCILASALHRGEAIRPFVGAVVVVRVPEPGVVLGSDSVPVGGTHGFGIRKNLKNEDSTGVLFRKVLLN